MPLARVPQPKAGRRSHERKKIPRSARTTGDIQKETLVRHSRQDNSTSYPLARQGFCAACAYFRVVPLPSGRVRKLCTLSGEKLTAAGRLCEFSRQEEEVTA